MVMGSLRQETEVAVVGAGPGGYVAALRAADLGKEVLLIEERARPGGVCLIEGCIPSKTLIGAVELADALRRADRMGLTASDLSIDARKLRSFTDDVIAKTSAGVASLLKGRGIEVIQGRARLTGKKSLAIEGGSIGGVDFKHCILATGSRFNELPGDYEAPVWSSAAALQLPSVPERLLVVGGGYIGLELGLVYAGLGSAVTVVEFFPRLLMGADADLVDVMVKSAARRFAGILLDSKVAGIERSGEGFAVTIEHEGQQTRQEFDQVLAAVGRRPNTEDLGLETVGIEVDEQGRIPVDEALRTSQPNIHAIGDIAPGPMLAHKASREGKVAAEVIAGEPAAFDNRAIPAVVFTDPEIAWVGITEREAKEQGLEVNVGRFPLRALGRARAIGRTEGLSKILSDPESGAILGIGMVGPQASELISEGALAIEMGATLEDLLVTIHPHPTLSESLLEAAEIAAGVGVHLPRPKKR
jgi:dihydrolipoamide dehydrogenase